MGEGRLSVGVRCLSHVLLVDWGQKHTELEEGRAGRRPLECRCPAYSAQTYGRRYLAQSSHSLAKYVCYLFMR